MKRKLRIVLFAASSVARIALSAKDWGAYGIVPVSAGTPRARLFRSISQQGNLRAVQLSLKQKALRTLNAQALR